MSKSVSMLQSLGRLTPRARLYIAALVVVGGTFLCLKAVGGTADFPLDVNLAFSATLCLALAGAEFCLLVAKLRQRRTSLELDFAREQAAHAQRVAARHQLLDQIAGTLRERLEFNQFPAEALDGIARFCEADVVGIWTVDRRTPQEFTCRGVHGLRGHAPESILEVPWAFPQFADPAQSGPVCLQDVARELVCPTHLTFCDREEVRSLVYLPVRGRDSLDLVLGLFYRASRDFPAAAVGEFATIANFLGSTWLSAELLQDLIRMQKIESVGTLASGIAHDFNNVLAAILACASYCRQHTEPGHPILRYLEATEESANRGAALTRQLLSFVRREDPRTQVVSVNTQLDQMLKLLERSFDKSILVIRHYAADVRPIEVDPSMLEQVILNLAVNARDAMRNGGFFTVTTKNITLHRENPYRPKVNLPDGDYVVLGFRDTGHGMDAATMKRIFEPFFTTKPKGRGTGLGLSLILSIVRSFGGEIRLESTVGVGTQFEIYLPASHKPVPEAVAHQAVAAKGGGECILIAEDEEIIREMAQLTLESKGYKVLAAADGAAALARYRENWQGIDLVVADMAMPRLSGPELLERMRQINPGVRVIVSSGYSQEQEGQRMLEHGCLGFLQKPYAPDQLCSAVRSILDSGL